jgi:low temperature requirement protein LtrA
MEERERLEEAEQVDQTFTWPVLGALYGSLVIVAVVAVLASGAGRGFEDEVDAPARTLVAAPVVLFAAVLFVASIVALIAPAARRASMRVAEIAGWLIPAWLVMCGMGIGAVAFALHSS